MGLGGSRLGTSQLGEAGETANAPVSAAFASSPEPGVSASPVTASVPVSAASAATPAPSVDPVGAVQLPAPATAVVSGSLAPRVVPTAATVQAAVQTLSSQSLGFTAGGGKLGSNALGTKQLGENSGALSVDATGSVTVTTTVSVIISSAPAPSPGYILGLPATTVSASPQDPTASGTGVTSITTNPTIVFASSQTPSVSGTGITSIAAAESVLAASSPTAVTFEYVLGVPASSAALSTPSPLVGSKTWQFDGTPVDTLIAEVRTWQDLELTFRANVDQRNSVFKPLDSHAGSVDIVVDSEGKYHAVDRAGDDNTYTLTPPVTREPPRLGGEFVVDDYSDSMVDQRAQEYQVSLKFTADESRSTSSGLSETRDSGQWLFEFSEGTLATERVSQDVGSGVQTGEASKRIELILDPEQTRCLEESATALEAVTVHEVPDGENFAVDESPGDTNTVTITAPTGADSILPSGTYAVNEWESKWQSDTTYRVTAELVELA